MIVKELKTFYIINKVKEHKNIKKEMLKLIDKIPLNSFQTKYENIIHSDYNLPINIDREYVNLFYKTISNYMQKIKEFLCVNKLEIHNCWFQKYKKGNFHNWHIHANAQFTNIYYLEMPNKNNKTKLYNIFSDKIIDIELEEGDLLTIPSFIHHKSEDIDDSHTKTIISFNSSFDLVNLELLKKQKNI
jgi:hypothetical protein